MLFQCVCYLCMYVYMWICIGMCWQSCFSVSVENLYTCGCGCVYIGRSSNVILVCVLYVDACMCNCGCVYVGCAGNCISVCVLCTCIYGPYMKPHCQRVPHIHIHSYTSTVTHTWCVFCMWMRVCVTVDVYMWDALAMWFQSSVCVYVDVYMWTCTCVYV